MEVWETLGVIVLAGTYDRRLFDRIRCLEYISSGVLRKDVSPRRGDTVRAA